MTSLAAMNIGAKHTTVESSGEIGGGSGMSNIELL